MGTRITHRDWKHERRVLNRIMKTFQTLLRDKAEKMILGNKVPGWDQFSDESLLTLRKRLVSYIKEGMLERKDMELEIAFIALCVHLQRMSHEDRIGFFEL